MYLLLSEEMEQIIERDFNDTIIWPVIEFLVA